MASFSPPQAALPGPAIQQAPSCALTPPILKLRHDGSMALQSLVGSGSHSPDPGLMAWEDGHPTSVHRLYPSSTSPSSISVQADFPSVQERLKNLAGGLHATFAFYPNEQESWKHF